jgi:hypothetical protein
MLREYKDRKGIQWRVWDVYPGPRTSGTTRVADAEVLAFPHRDLAEGWLCFESATEKRRIAPIPSGWEFMDSAGLEEICERAGFVSQSRATKSRSGNAPLA